MTTTLSTTCRIPADERDIFYRLREEEQIRIKQLTEQCFPVVMSAKSLTEGYRKAARMCNYSEVTIKRSYTAFRKQGWKGLIHNYKGREKLPEPFVQYWKALCERNQRKCKPAWRQIIRDWKAWSRGDESCAMPGYRSCPPAYRKTGVPHGWLYRNMMNYAPTNYEQKSVRISTNASYKEKRLVFTTRAGLEVGEFYQFDDVWHDHKVNVLGQRQAMRPLEFNSIDVFSAYKNAYAIKPITENLDPTTKNKTNRLKEREMMLVTIGLLATEGYRPKGTTLVVEHGTAAIGEDIEAMLYELTDGAVRVNRSGIETGEAFTGQYAGVGKGNFRMKASLESLHNLIHNEFGFLPGQIGMNRDHSPAELAGREKANNALLKAIAAIAESDPNLASQIILPFCEINQFRRFADQVYAQINSRTDHNLEGWVEAGNVLTEWRPDYSLPWQPQERLLAIEDPRRREATLALIESDRDLMRTRKMSPAEVYNRGRANLVKLPRSSAAMLLKNAIGRDVKVGTGSSIEFEDSEAGPGTFRFLSRVKDRAGRETILQRGEKFTGVMNPYFPDTLDLIDASGAWIGSCPAFGNPAKNDEAALKRELGEANRVNADLMKPIQFRGSDILKQRLKETTHNNRMIAGGKDPQRHPFEPRKATSKAQVRANRRDADLARAARESQDDY